MDATSNPPTASVFLTSVFVRSTYSGDNDVDFTVEILAVNKTSLNVFLKVHTQSHMHPK